MRKICHRGVAQTAGCNECLEAPSAHVSPCRRAGYIAIYLSIFSHLSIFDFLNKTSAGEKVIKHHILHSTFIHLHLLIFDRENIIKTSAHVSPCRRECYISPNIEIHKSLLFFWKILVDWIFLLKDLKKISSIHFFNSSKWKHQPILHISPCRRPG